MTTPRRWIPLLLLFASPLLAADFVDDVRPIFERSCNGCHGPNGLSRTPGTPHLAGQRIVYLYRALQAMAENRRQEREMLHAVDTLNRDTLLNECIDRQAGQYHGHARKAGDQSPLTPFCVLL